MNIWYCSSEAVPYFKTGGLADVSASLTQAWAQLGHRVKLLLPLYRQLDRKKYPIENVKTLTLHLGLCDYTITVWRPRAKKQAVEVWFIDLPWAFDRSGLYGAPQDYPDNLQRFAVFGRALAALAQEDGGVDVLVGNDWQCGPLMAYARIECPQALRVFCIHNLAYQGLGSMYTISQLELDRYSHHLHYEFHHQVSSMKLGLTEADLLLTVSPGYAKEIQTSAYGCGLEEVLRERGPRLQGILNGIDEPLWSPQTRKLPYPYTARSLGKKRQNLHALQKKWGLGRLADDAPVFGFVGRLDSQKGVDLLVEAFSRWLERNPGQLCVLGAGHPHYVTSLAALQASFPKRVGLGLTFDAALAEQVYAASDFFVMPSRYEPCGLGQLIAYRFGALPIVRHTGGLADTVNDIKTKNASGLVFDEATPHALEAALTRALKLFKQKNRFHQLQVGVMGLHFTWETSAQAYLRLFEKYKPGIEH